MNKRCQIFTPKQYVDMLLDNANYKHNLYGKKFLENSCGNGSILLVAVERYIKDCKKNKISTSKISKGLSSDFAGYEIDKKYCRECVIKLNNITEKYGIKNVKWKINNKDYLRSEETIKYDYIIGNPPYISYKDINIKDRKYIRNKFLTCKNGKFDYSYAFIEKSIKDLSNEGTIAYLIPTSISKAVFANDLRLFIKQYLIKLIEFGYAKVFDDAIIKPAIFVMKKQVKNNKFKYIKNGKQKTIDKKVLDEEKWTFIENINKNKKKRFGDYYKVSHCVATLCNEVFVVDNNTIDEFSLERKILVKTTSPRTVKKNEYLIFPYKYVNNKLIKFNATELKKAFPNTYMYLLKHREKLNNRKIDSNAKWYEYGRSQALTHINVDKILMSTIVTDKPKITILNNRIIPYGGIYIAPKGNKGYNLLKAKKILESKEFVRYIKKIGINVNGNSYRVTSKDIENYSF